MYYLKTLTILVDNLDCSKKMKIISEKLRKDVMILKDEMITKLASVQYRTLKNVNQHFEKKYIAHCRVIILFTNRRITRTIFDWKQNVNVILSCSITAWYYASISDGCLRSNKKVQARGETAALEKRVWACFYLLPITRATPLFIRSIRVFIITLQNIHGSWLR